MGSNITLMTALAAVVLLLDSVGGQMSWRACDGPTQDLPAQAFDVALVPDPPVIGSPATFTINAHSTAQVAAGAVDITISFLGIEIFSKSEDLCSLTTCPMQPGDVKIVLVEDLPPIAPPGSYSLLLQARAADDTEVICLNVDFELVLPSTSTATAPKWHQSSQIRKIGPVA